jgi:hypothetical protein
VAVGFDLIQAVIQQLENNSVVQTAFGSTWNQAAQTGVPKFFADQVDQVSPPYCLIEEGGETYDFMTRSGPIGQLQTNFDSPGRMSFQIFAPGRGQARQLGFVIATALNDAPLSWPAENNTMMFRMSRSWFMPMTQPSGPGVATLFCRAFVFDYMYSASLQDFA